MSNFNDVNQWIDEINRHIIINLKTGNKYLKNILEQQNIFRGKKVRGIFCMTAATYGKFKFQKVLAAAVAIEILHAATLVHDDIIDDATTRRGNKTINSKYGRHMAVITGDYLFTKAVLLVSDLMGSKHLSVIARALKGMCEGEVSQYHQRYDLNISRLKYFRVITKKTALLFMMSTLLGAFVAKCTEKTTIKNLERFAFCYGIAFQIYDDLKDLISEEQKEGKPVLNDLRAGTITLPIIYAIEESELIKNLLQDISKNPVEENNIIWTQIRDEILKTDAVKRTYEVIEKFKNRARDNINRLPKNTNSEIFIQMLDHIGVTR